MNFPKLLKVDFKLLLQYLYQLMSSSVNLVAEYEEKGVFIAQFKTSMLAVFTYYVQSQNQAYLIDPTYDNLIYKEYIKKRGSTLKYVVLTHYHADFIGGHTQFGVPLIMGPNSKRQGNNFDLIEIPENGKFKVGNAQTRVISTPGHTLQSSCFILSNEDGKQFCIFTGDTVFIKQVGRPDLATNGTITIEDLAGMLYDSLQKIKSLDGNLRIFPGHGSGSACGKSISAGNFCDIKSQSEQNYAFLINDRKQFIEKMIKDLVAPPSYFYYDAKLNQQGISTSYEEAFKKVNRPLSFQEIENHVNSGVTLVDTRHVPVNGIPKGSYWISSNATICQLISHVLEPEKSFIVIADEEKRVEVLERFIRVGFNNILGYNDFDMKEWRGELVKAEIRKFEELQKNRQQAFIDCRNLPELLDTGYFNGALFIPISQLKNRLDEVAQYIKKHEGKEIVIQCKSGMRARLGASLMLNNGLGPVTVFNEVIDKVHEKGAVLVPYVQN